MRIIQALTVCAACALGAAAATAAPVEVREVVEIKAPPAAVWAKIGEWCAIKNWHPAIASCDATKSGFRTLTLKSGGKILEKLTKTGKNSYSYDILEGPLPVKGYQATLAAKADSLGSTDLTWTAKFEPKGKTAAEAQAVIKGIFETGLKNIKETLKFDGTTGAAVATAAAATATTAAATTAAATAASPQVSKEEARLKAREERRKRLEAAKLAALEKYAEFKAKAAEKAKATADAAKAAYEKAKAAISQAMQPKPADPKKP